MGEPRSRSDPDHAAGAPEDERRDSVTSLQALGQLGRALLADLLRLWRALSGWAVAAATRLRLGRRAGSAYQSVRSGMARGATTFAGWRRTRAAESPAEEAPAPDPPPRRASGRRFRWGFLVSFLAVGTGGAAVLVAGLLAWAVWDMDFGAAAAEGQNPSVVMETIEGEPFASKGPFKGTPVVLTQLPPHLIGAVVSIEDRRFFAHPGVDIIGVTRALFANLAAGEIVEGGSTISQQLARTLFLTQDRTLRRKLREAALAIWLEARMTKEEILARYLGSIYMGAGVHGIPAAAQVYFGKDPKDLTLAESAMLAGLIRAPSDLNPRADIAAARARAAVVLAAMVETGAIGQAEADAALAEPAELNDGAVAVRSGGWFADWIYEEAAELAGSFNGALHVGTTLHPRVQALAEEAIATVMDAEGAEANASEAAMVVMLADGAVLALVGGRDYEASQFNRATNAARQPGSTFKPFVYYAALRRGWSMEDRIEDAPIEIRGWRPQNYGGGYRGTVTLAEALASSLNAATVRLAHEVGIENVAAAARELGIDAELVPNPSLALGTSEVTLLDLTGAYASILAAKAPVEPWGILDFGTAGTDRYRLGPRTATTPIPPDLRNQLLNALTLAVERGTGRAAQIDGVAAGKTGTTQDHRDAWFVGFTGPFIAGVWVGNDDNSPMNNVTGGKLPANIWRAFMTSFLDMLQQGDPVFQPVTPQEVRPVSTPAARTGDGVAEFESVGPRRGQELACNVRACERAYRSFRRSDCTFQPYRGPRKRCAK